MTTITQLTIDEFYAAYLPQKNDFDDNASWNGCMLETYGDDYEYVKTVHALAPDRLWTIIDGGDHPILTNGFHYVNRIGYVVTVRPAPEDTFIEVVDN
jgi:hypothetical protein